MASTVSTNSVWPNYSTSNVQKAAAKESTSTLGKDDFLQLLVTQLSNQDPSSPMDNTEFIAQMAQFTSLEQMMNMSDEMSKLRQSLSAASNLIGMTVEWTGLSDEGVTTTYSGMVEAVTVKDGVQYAKVGDYAVNVDDLNTITYSSSSSTASSEEENSNE
ncbi:flagellar basal-body rod modification protein FlgD [Paenibacillus cellulosilyticus]|uniref:Flagellar basal-body rod modification protein FlgD n=1 Tax=Paenibacillus cellulosilyticus TaxID=375489 RepID=A0A2V2Z1C1_9BACL|nr:flagellar hook assembly protein FlgD [Paenibacillus cellulosilyticus]PWW06399.1 flagellar basal-body rod modification protein FlgD [Paenibacillus cellulosilyticus]QKS46634.1 flagellar hook assembly protein FlgD [Paenibacillus cellulosilyticus]